AAYPGLARVKPTNREEAAALAAYGAHNAKPNQVVLVEDTNPPVKWVYFAGRQDALVDFTLEYVPIASPATWENYQKPEAVAGSWSALYEGNAVLGASGEICVDNQGN